VSYATISEIGSPPLSQSQGILVATKPATPRQRTHELEMSPNATEQLVGSMEALFTQIIEFSEEMKEATNALSRHHASAARVDPRHVWAHMPLPELSFSRQSPHIIPGHMKSELVYYCESVL
jgi:hypothetical protein